MNFANISFGSNLNFSKEQINLGEEFFKKDSANSGKLRVEAFKGNLNVSDIKFPSNAPTFENVFKGSPTVSTPPTPPSTRPYIWKYQ
jgi:hypothetical protein